MNCEQQEKHKVDDPHASEAFEVPPQRGALAMVTKHVNNPPEPHEPHQPRQSLQPEQPKTQIHTTPTVLTCSCSCNPPPWQASHHVDREPSEEISSGDLRQFGDLIDALFVGAEEVQYDVETEDPVYHFVHSHPRVPWHCPKRHPKLNECEAKHEDSGRVEQASNNDNEPELTKHVALPHHQLPAHLWRGLALQRIHRVRHEPLVIDHHKVRRAPWKHRDRSVDHRPSNLSRPQARLRRATVVRCSRRAHL
mmetsp:Transcript_80455/g.233534  ORF Transcript_80455/g.233534 Transcript_80455/m.233534 type:complete len:251 (-) Transcript_80455:39-791(-)